jgi:hypothetical protein
MTSQWLTCKKQKTKSFVLLKEAPPRIKSVPANRLKIMKQIYSKIFPVIIAENCIIIIVLIATLLKKYLYEKIVKLGGGGTG